MEIRLLTNKLHGEKRLQKFSVNLLWWPSSLEQCVVNGDFRYLLIASGFNRKSIGRARDIISLNCP